VGEVLLLASRLGMLCISYLSQNVHLLVQVCVHLSKVWPSYSCQHELVGDAIPMLGFATRQVLGETLLLLRSTR
jgi:hypothetical protein